MSYSGERHNKGIQAWNKHNVGLKKTSVTHVLFALVCVTGTVKAASYSLCSGLQPAPCWQGTEDTADRGKGGGRVGELTVPSISWKCGGLDSEGEWKCTTEERRDDTCTKENGSSALRGGEKSFWRRTEKKCDFCRQHLEAGKGKMQRTSPQGFLYDGDLEKKKKKRKKAECMGCLKVCMHG